MSHKGMLGFMHKGSGSVFSLPRLHARQARKQGKPKPPLAERFPFAGCSPELAQLPAFIEECVRYAVADYTSPEAKQVAYIRGYTGAGAGDDDDCTIESGPKTPVSTHEPSLILVKRPEEEFVLKERLCALLLADLQQMLGFAPRLMANSVVVESVNYATNVFLQDVTGADAQPTAAQLREIADDFLDKYEELALAVFEDEVTACASDGCSVGRSSVERPAMYDLYRQIWALDPANAAEFAVETFISEYGDDGLLPQLALRDRLCGWYGATAVKMNMHKFHRQFALERPQRGRPALNYSLGEVQSCVAQLVRCSSGHAKRTDKSIRFVEATEIVY